MSEDGRIKVIGDWYITLQGDPVNYVVRRGAGERSVTKNGEPGGYKDRPLAYCSGLPGTLRYIRRQIINERLKTSENGLKQAIDTIREVNKEFEFVIGDSTKK